MQYNTEYTVLEFGSWFHYWPKRNRGEHKKDRERCENLVCSTLVEVNVLHVKCDNCKIKAIFWVFNVFVHKFAYVWIFCLMTCHQMRVQWNAIKNSIRQRMYANQGLCLTLTFKVHELNSKKRRRKKDREKNESIALKIWLRKKVENDDWKRR